MTLKPPKTLAEIVQKHKDDTHHIRIKIAPEMFRVYCRIMPEIEAKNLVCELLKISHAGFDIALYKDPLAEIAVYKRNQTILDLRCQGYSFAAIGDVVNLSRVQIWRVIQAFESKIETIRFMECRKVKNTRLKYPDLEKIEKLRQKLANLRPKKGAGIEAPPAQVYSPSNPYFFSRTTTAIDPNSSIAAPR